MFCPVHEDTRRSAQINFDKGVWFCHAEGIGGSIDDLLEQQSDWVAPRGAGSTNGRARAPKTATAPAELPGEGTIAGWRAALLADPIALEDLKSARGIWTKTCDYFEIGWDASAQCYKLPIRDADGAVVNVRSYQLRPPKGRRKIWGVEGHNKPALYPLSALGKAKDYVIICEGEWDALSCNQHNFRAVTRTGSAGTWSDDWSSLFEGMTVYVCHDSDKAGQRANRKVARSVAAHAAEVRIVRLPYAITPKDGKDLTDWWLEHDSDTRAFQRLLDEATPFDEQMGDDPDEIDPSPASVIDAFDSRRSGKPMALTVTIQGRRDPGYTIPRRIEYRCKQDQDKKCLKCPMNRAEGEMDFLVAGTDPVILEMIDATFAQLQEAQRRAIRAPKCPSLRMKAVENQAVEMLFARPSVEHSNGSNADYKNIKLTSVGRHDTSPNQTVRVVGSLHPAPKSQLNEFLTWDVSRLETSLDRFDMDEETHKMLSVFQSEQPLAKVREIADDLSSHVTFIVGRPEMHAAFDLVFHSAIGFDFDGKRLSRGWLELLVIGDTRTGKSEAAAAMARFYGAGEVVSCEAASYAGIIGGLQQFGGREWSITWGTLPINDRRLVVLDEIGGLTPEEIAAMSSVRSSGIAELHKIQHERTHARTRLIWLGNPRNAKMVDYTYGVQAIQPLIGNPEDIARFDLAMSVASGDVSSLKINRTQKSSRQRYGREPAARLLRWVWSRTPEQVKWASGAVEEVYKAANDLGARYIEDPPLIQAANVREKVARLSVAIAGRLFSTDERGEDIIVGRRHVQAAVQFIDRLYTMDGFGYSERSAEVIDDRRRAQSPKNIKAARIALQNNEGLGRFLRGQGKFRRQDLEEILDIDREEANGIISTLVSLRMVYKDRGDVRLTPTLHTLLKEKNE